MTASVCDFTFLKGVKVVDFTQFEAGARARQGHDSQGGRDARELRQCRKWPRAESGRCRASAARAAQRASRRSSPASSLRVWPSAAHRWRLAATGAHLVLVAVVSDCVEFGRRRGETARAPRHRPCTITRRRQRRRRYGRHRRQWRLRLRGAILFSGASHTLIERSAAPTRVSAARRERSRGYGPGAG